MKLCILDNDRLDAPVRPRWGSYGAMTERLLRAAGWHGAVHIFQACRGEYPQDWTVYDAVLLTGSRADAFGDEPWVRTLRAQVLRRLQAGQRLLGICFGHQLIAHCLGAPVARAPQGWGQGRMVYDWHGQAGVLPGHTLALYASHQDQVLALPTGATLLASSAHCPVAAYAVGRQVLCVQPHPEFDAAYAAYLLGKRRQQLGEALYQERVDSLQQGHDGALLARCMVDFVQQAV
jgi:GMP synthase-like glutamine amidotransferase